MKIVAGIFDVGSVLCKSDSKKLRKDVQERLSLTDGQLKEAVRGIADKIETGKTSEWQYFNEFIKSHNIKRIVPKDLLRRSFEENFRILPTFNIVKKLKQMSLILAELSNTVPSHADVIRKAGLYDLFDEVILSFEVGLRKPDPRIYELILNRLNIKSEQTFFVDDREENVRAAQGLGIKSFLFESPESLKRDLRKLGLVV